MTELSRSQRTADTVTWFCGTWTFVFLFAAFTDSPVSISDAFVEVICDKCGVEEQITLTALAQSHSWDERNVRKRPTKGEMIDYIVQRRVAGKSRLIGQGDKRHWEGC